MKRILILSFLFACCAVTSIYAADFKIFWDRVETLKKQGISCNISSVTDKEINQAVNAKFYMKMNKIRMDADEGIIIIDDKNMYIYSKQENIVMKLNINNDDVKQMLFNIIQDKANELNFVENSLKNGYSCQVFKSKDDGKDIIYYLTNNYGFPTYVKEENSEINITDFKVGKISDDIFVLPENINIVDMADFSIENMIKKSI